VDRSSWRDHRGAITAARSPSLDNRQSCKDLQPGIGAWRGHEPVVDVPRAIA
jgi:hypothetical protein